MLYRASTTYLYFEIIRENPKCFALSLVFTHLDLKKDKVELKFVIGDRPNYEPPFVRARIRRQVVACRLRTPSRRDRLCTTSGCRMERPDMCSCRGRRPGCAAGLCHIRLGCLPPISRGHKIPTTSCSQSYQPSLSLIVRPRGPRMTDILLRRISSATGS